MKFVKPLTFIFIALLGLAYKTTELSNLTILGLNAYGLLKKFGGFK